MRFHGHQMLLLVLGACSPPAASDDVGSEGAVDARADVSTATGPVMDNARWEPVDAANDPFADRPDIVECERGVGWDTEPLEPEPVTVGIDTLDCNYWGVEQPLRRAVQAGETLAVHIWHFQLEGDGPAHLGAAIADEIVWEKTVEIPAESALIVEEFELSTAVSEGERLIFHLHNHGINSWNFIAVRPLNP